MTTVAAGIQQEEEESHALKWGVYLMSFAAVGAALSGKALLDERRI